ncbi:MAG: DUF4199 domain-containing protein [Bacteroidetes bacterium]|nr:DUF4199 domain-containing protein [Bacteroidota bacterium]
MRKTILKFGAISAGVFAVFISAMIPFEGCMGGIQGMIFGYSTMLLSFLTIYFGVRSYRQNTGEGFISFGRALSVALLIMLIGCIGYVVSWEVINHFFLPNFADTYSAKMVEQMKASGAPQANIDSQIQMMKLYKENIFFNMAMTFAEPLPVGLLVSLLSAIILRKKKVAAE